MPIENTKPTPGTQPAIRQAAPKPKPIEPQWTVKPDTFTLQAPNPALKLKEAIRDAIAETEDGSEPAILGPAPLPPKEKQILGIREQFDDSTVFEAKVSPKHRGTVSVGIKKTF